MSEGRRVESLFDWYPKEQLDFDKRLIRFRYQMLKPHLQRPEGLEFGPAEGEMTKQIQGYWTEEMVYGFYELGKDFPGNAAELYAVCQSP